MSDGAAAAVVSPGGLAASPSTVAVDAAAAATPLFSKLRRVKLMCGPVPIP
jgi:hypothetical protein